jgi:3-oxoadipate enol-lactonase
MRPVTPRRIDTPGATLAVNDFGEGDPALIFLHYWGGSAATWDAVIARLPSSAHGIALNQRGWGGSVATDGRYDLDTLADDVLAVTAALAIRRFVIVGHSMGGKIGQILAGRRASGLAGLVLVAPAPPTPMGVPQAVREAMLASYQSREGVLQALGVLAGSPLADPAREQVIADTLRGAPDAKRAWPEHGMTQDISAGLEGCTLPVSVLVGERDQVERPDVLRPALTRFLPQAEFTIVPEAGHLLPLEAPGAIADACRRMLAELSRA